MKDTIRELQQAQAEVERLRALLTAQKAEVVRRWVQAKEDADKGAEALYRQQILDADQALLQDNWIQMKWKAEGR